VTYFHLKPEWRDILLRHVPEGSDAHAAIRRAKIVNHDPNCLLVKCELAEVQLLYEAAKEHCRDAESAISVAVTIALRGQPKASRKRHVLTASARLPVQLSLDLD